MTGYDNEVEYETGNGMELDDKAEDDLMDVNQHSVMQLLAHTDGNLFLLRKQLILKIIKDSLIKLGGVSFDIAGDGNCLVNSSLCDQYGHYMEILYRRRDRN